MLRNIMYMMSGGMLAQAISLGTVVFLTRFYTPDDFGIFGTFSAIVLILASFVCLKFDVAMIVRKGNGRAGLLFHASWISMLFLVLLVAGLVWVAGPFVGAQLQFETGAPYLIMVPVAVLLTGLVLLFSQMLVRKRKFRAFSMMRVGQSVMTGAAQLGLVGLSATGLILGYMLGLVAAAALMIKPVFTDRFFMRSHPRRIFTEMRRTRKFASVSSVTGLINVIGLQLPLVLCAALFGPAAAGLYAVSQRVLALPANLIGITMGQTFLAEIRRPEKQVFISRMTLDIYCLLLALGIAPAIFLFLYGGVLFQLVFGDEWYDAGVIAAWHAPWVLSAVVVTVMLQVFFLREKLRPVFWYTSGFTGIRLATLFAIFYLDGGFMAAMIGLALSGTALNIVIILWALWETDNKAKVILVRTVQEIWKPSLVLVPFLGMQALPETTLQPELEMMLAVAVLLASLGAMALLKIRGGT